MKNYIIAWRNLWRNKRRTFITISSIFFGVILSTFQGSMQEGSYSSMINNVVKFYSGYIQIQDKDFWENKTLYYAFQPGDSLREKIADTEGITTTCPRLESFALISSGDKTQAVMVVGIEPEMENQVTMLSKWIVTGKYLTAGDRSILLAEELAANLNASVGDSIVLLSQGYYGSNEAARFKVEGILKFPSPELNKKFCYLDLSMAQEFYSADGMVTSLVLMVDDYSEVNHVIKNLRNDLDPAYSAMSWDEMQPELIQMIRGDRAGGQVMIGILYLIIAFGILGTIIMMIAERKKELAIMVAIGMQKIKLGEILFLETLYIGLIGVLSGIIVSIPIIIIMIHNPIPLTGETAKVMLDMGFEPLMYFTGSPKIFITQFVVVFSITVLVSLYPLISAIRLNVIRWMRG
jgi:ABC-type lipoprotein release transport system permease subunit